MTFDLDHWPTDLNINRDHLLTKDYLPTKFEASGAKCSWVISCTRWSKLAWPLTLTFDLLTWISIGIIYSPRTIYLPSLKLLGQSVIELSVAQGEGLPTYRHTDRLTDIPTDRQVQSNMPSFFKGGHKYISTCIFELWSIFLIQVFILVALLIGWLTYIKGTVVNVKRVAKMHVALNVKM